MRESTAREIFSILADLGGASTSLKPEFLHFAMHDQSWSAEFRFQGKFGFGGKIYLEGDVWRVAYYPEDQTPELDALATTMNERLSELHKRVGGH